MAELIGMGLNLYIIISVVVSLVWLFGVAKLSESEIGVVAGGMFCPFIGYFWPFTMGFLAVVLFLSLFGLMALFLRNSLN